MRLSIWSLVYLGALAIAVDGGIEVGADLGPSSSPIGFELVAGIFGAIFFASITYGTLSRKFREGGVKFDWNTNLLSSSPLKNPQSNSLIQGVFFCTGGLTIGLTGLKMGGGIGVGAFFFVAGIGPLFGLWLFRRRVLLESFRLRSQ
jgi:hypothetical protein